MSLENYYFSIELIYARAYTRFILLTRASRFSSVVGVETTEMKSSVLTLYTNFIWKKVIYLYKNETILNIFKRKKKPFFNK